jgi:hypothetical protein
MLGLGRGVPGEDEVRDQVSDVDPGGAADGLRPVDQPGLPVRGDEQVAGVDVAVQERVAIRRCQPPGLDRGQAAEVAAGPGIRVVRRGGGQFLPAVDQPG